MTAFNFENFYFEHIGIENYDTIMQELRPYVLVKLNQMDANYYSGLLRLPEKELIDKCPAMSNWFEKNNMELIMSAIHIMQARRVGQLHSDSNEDTTSRLALNLDIENADVNKTKLYKISVPGTMHYTAGDDLPYIVYQNNKETCEQVAEYDLSKPVLFDNVKPHSVTNHTNKRRIAITLRFRSDPIHLLAGRS